MKSPKAVSLILLFLTAAEVQAAGREITPLLRQRRRSESQTDSRARNASADSRPHRVSRPIIRPVVVEAPLPPNGNQSWISGGYSDSGWVIGKIAACRHSGCLFKSWEIDFNFSEVRDGTYDSTLYHYSVLNHARGLEIQELLNTDPYVVIKYEYSLLPNPFRRSTGYDITDIRPVQFGDDPVAIGQLPRSMEDLAAVTTGIIEAETGTTTGIIAKVQRWGLVQSGCAVTLNLNGRKSVLRHILQPYSQSSTSPDEARSARKFVKISKTVLNTEKFNVVSDEVCQYAERLLPFAQKVVITYGKTVPHPLRFKEYGNYPKTVLKISLR